LKAELISLKVTSRISTGKQHRNTSSALAATVPIAAETVAGVVDGPADALEAVVDDADATVAADMVATAVVAEDVTRDYSATKGRGESRGLLF